MPEAAPLLDPKFLARLEQLEIASRKIFQGRMKGERLSRKKGQSVEFADYRNYVVGDDLRFLDWNLFGRLDKLFIRLFLEEEDLHFYILIDNSLSMDFGNPSKLHYARQIAAALGFIGLVNMDRVVVEVFNERMTQSFDYEAIMLGLTNVDLDPNGEMNVWLSSSDNHQWNPSQKTPETPWEAEIDRLMHAQASASDARKRKEAFDRVQEIVVEQEPFIFLINKNALSAVSTTVHGAAPVILSPQTFWNAERLTVSGSR